VGSHTLITFDHIINKKPFSKAIFERNIHKLNVLKIEEGETVIFVVNRDCYAIDYQKPMKDLECFIAE
jgi:hypothetical protein